MNIVLKLCYHAVPTLTQIFHVLFWDDWRLTDAMDFHYK